MTDEEQANVLAPAKAAWQDGRGLRGEPFTVFAKRADTDWPSAQVTAVPQAHAPASAFAPDQDRGTSPVTARAQLQIYKIDNTHIGISAGGFAALPIDATLVLTVSGGTAGTPKRIYGKVDVSASDVPTLPVWYDNGTATPALDTTHAYQLLGTFYTSAGVLFVNPDVAGSQGLSICRSYPDNNVVPTWTLV